MVLYSSPSITVFECSKPSGTTSSGMSFTIVHSVPFISNFFQLSCLSAFSGSSSALLVTTILYVLVLPSSAVTTTLTVFSPTSSESLPVTDVTLALESAGFAVTARLEQL